LETDTLVVGDSMLLSGGNPDSATLRPRWPRTLWGGVGCFTENPCCTAPQIYSILFKHRKHFRCLVAIASFSFWKGGFCKTEGGSFKRPLRDLFWSWYQCLGYSKIIALRRLWIKLWINLWICG